MTSTTTELHPTPPLRLLWTAQNSLYTAVAGSDRIYGITREGHVAAYSATTGQTLWLTNTTYAVARLGVDGQNLYAFQLGVGLIKITDQGTAKTEQTLFEASTLDNSTPLSQPIVQEKLVHFVLGNRLMAVDPAGGGVRFFLDLNNQGPHSLFTIGTDLLVLSGAGRPRRVRVGNGAYVDVWDTGVSNGGLLREYSGVLSGNMLFVGDQEGVAAYDVYSGARRWAAYGVGNLALTVQGDTLYCAGNQAAIWALDPTSGAIKWDRQYLAFVTQTSRVGLVAWGKHLWVGALLDDGYEPAVLWAMNLADGGFAWQAAGINLRYGNGLPLLLGETLYTYGGPDPLAAMGSLSGTPGILVEGISQAPSVLHGNMADFGTATLSLRMPVAAKVTFVSWHERDSRSNPFGPTTYPAGNVNITYDPKWPWGWTAVRQFGRMLFEIEETASGLKYSQVLLIPVNTLPDIYHHWAKQQIEAMIARGYIGGYPDLTFRPDNLITRAETSTIIAKTLGVSQPSAGFRTKFTDIASHWARNYIMVLEEKGILGGFQEPDGTFTFRPNLNMTRAQNAKVLVKAYDIPLAPHNFETRFTDIAGHWAEVDIKALENKGYTSGFREADGSYTFRPERNLTRAELSTMVVRIRGL